VPFREALSEEEDSKSESSEVEWEVSDEILEHQADK
jgi:hypothetical protein